MINLEKRERKRKERLGADNNKVIFNSLVHSRCSRLLAGPDFEIEEISETK